MGVLAKSLATQSSYAAKQQGLWDALMDELAGCLFPAAVDAFEEHCAARGLQIPHAYRESLAEEIEKHREAIASEDIGSILRDRFDFT